MLSTHRGVTTMATYKALSLLLLLVTACEGASLVLEASTLRISKDGEANFTLNCTTDEASRSGENSQMQKEIVDVQRMRISKMKDNQWEPILQMDSDWESPLVHPGVTGDHDLASGFLQATWPMATNSTAGEYTCDLVGSGVIGQLVSLRSPAVYIDVHFPMTLYDLFKMVKTSSKKFETASADIARNKDLIRRANTNIAQNKEAIETTSADIAENKEAIERSSTNITQNKEVIEETSGDIMWLKKSFESSSTHIAQNTEAIETASAIISQNEKAINLAFANIMQNNEALEMASADITENKEVLEMASADITENKEAIEMVSAGITENKGAIKMASVGIAQNEQAIKQTKIGQGTFNRILQRTSNTVENNAATLAQVKQKQNFITSFFQRWPQGRYDLLKPKSGCPKSTKTTSWQNFYSYRVRVEPSGVKISTGGHITEPVISSDGFKNYMKIYYCSVNDSPSVGSLWPSGSYCVDRAYPYACPTGFSEGRITYGKKDPCLGCADRINYCCRKDSLPDTAILLPTRHSFYLYRFGGKCQRVWGMTATEEYMIIDTECCGSSYSGSVPDGKKTSSEVTLQLCYYEKDTNEG